MTSTIVKTSEYRIYVACLAAYNNGKLHGVWIDLEGKDADDIQAEIDEMLESSPEPDAEEWRIDDTEGLEGFNVEDMSLTNLADLVEALEEKGDSFKAFYQWIGDDYSDICDAIDAYDERYQGEFETKEDYGIDYFQNTGEYQKLEEMNIVDYVDFEGWVNDCENGGDIEVIEYGYRTIYVFSNH